MEVEQSNAELPEEILEAIIQQLGPRPGLHPRYYLHDHTTTLSSKRHWSSCSLVCRRWRRITLPFLFRRIRILGEAHSLKERTWEVRDAAFRRRLFALDTETNGVTSHIREVTIENGVLRVSTVRHLVQLLPNLRSLVLSGVTLARKTNGAPSVDAPGNLSRETRELDHLLYYPPDDANHADSTTPESSYNLTLLELLSLFSVIGTLWIEHDLSLAELNWHDPGTRMLQTIASQLAPSIRDLRIHGLSIRSLSPSVMPPYYRILNNDLGLFRSLSYLHIKKTTATKRERGLLNELLLSAGPTLSELRLGFRWQWCPMNWYGSEDILQIPSST